MSCPWPKGFIGFGFEKPENCSQNGSENPPHAAHFFWPKIHGVPLAISGQAMAQFSFSVRVSRPLWRLLETPLLAAGGCSTTQMDFNPAALPAIPISVLETQTSVAGRKMPK